MRPILLPVLIALGLSGLETARAGCAEIFDGTIWPKDREAQLESLYQLGLRALKDRRAVLNQRLDQGDPHAAVLMRLGDQDAGASFKYPTRFRDLIRKYRQEAGAEGFALTLAYTDGQRLVWAAPDVDPWPNDPKLHLVLQVPQIPHQDWERLMSQGRMPFSLQSQMMDHDLGHATDLLDPGIQGATLDYYRQAAARPSRWREMVDHYLTPEQSEVNPDWLLSGYETARRHAQRVILFAEFLSLPRIEAAFLIRELLPEPFAPGGPRTLSEQMRLLYGLSHEAIAQRIGSWIRAEPWVLLRSGGALRDSLNRDRFLERRRVEPFLRELIRSGMTLSEDQRLSYQGSPLGAAMIDGLHGLLYQLEILQQMASERSTREIRYALIDRLARFETAMARAIELGVTPAQIIRDSSGETMDPGSVTYQYFSSFAEPGSIHYGAYVSAASRGRPVSSGP